MSNILREREENTNLSVDKLDVLRTLRVAVTGTVLGTSLVARVLRHTTILVHLTQVESTVETTGEVRHINVECELLVLQLEHLVLCRTRHEVDTRADVGACHELEGERITTSSDTVSARVICTVQSTVLGASGGIGAEGGVPAVTGVSVGVA